MQFKTIILTITVALVMTACGGGGSGNNNGGGSNGLVSLSPNKMTQTIYTGERTVYQVIATPGAALDGNVYVKVVAPGEIFDSNIDIRSAVYVNPSPSANGKYVVTLSTNRLTTKGSFSGNLAIAFCKDVGCIQQYPGSPIQYPYAITVKDIPANPKVMPLISGLHDWSSYHLDNRRNSFVAANFEPNQFSERWSWTLSGQGSPTAVVADANAAYLAIRTRYDLGARMIALSANNGSEIWTYNRPALAGYHDFSEPVIENGRVYTALSGGSGSDDATILGLSKYTGSEELYHRAYYSNTPVTISVANGKVYIALAYGGIQTLLNGTVNPLWMCSDTPAFDDSFFYGKDGCNSGDSKITVLNQSDGKTTSTLDAAGNPILIDGTYLLANDRLSISKVNYLDQTTAWSVNGTFQTDPVSDGNFWYIVNIDDGNTLQARNLSNGNVVWSWLMPQASVSLSPSIVATNNLVFVSTGLATFAINSQTGQEVWSYPRGGKLAIAPNGILYISSPNALSVTAINLR